MAKLNPINQLLLLAFLFSMTKVTHGQGQLLVKLDVYTSNDRTTNCIKFCVTTSPSGFPRCNLNTTTGTSTTEFRRTRKLPDPHIYRYKFTEWEDNSELSATVWKRPPGQSCDTSAPTNSTSYGEGSIIIPRLEELRVRYVKTDKWEITVNTKLICDKPGCISSCRSRDNSTGHYTCLDGNKECKENWFNEHENCTTFCNETSLTFQCTKNGSKVCNAGYFGKDCDIFCDRNATNYKCDEKGRRTCLANWYNKNCDQFCNNSEGNYVCDNEGRRVCLLHWYGEDCAKYCDNSALRYKCNDEGDRVCLRDWYGPNCSKFCSHSDKRFKCNDDGDKICLRNWYGKNCTIFCNSSNLHYKCNAEGNRICSKNWYGPDCLKFCDNNNVKFKCNSDGGKICMPNWYGENCTVFCNNTAALSGGKTARYFCNKNGQKTCYENLYGPQCNLRCTPVRAGPSESNSVREQSDMGLYYCEMEGGSQLENSHCPGEWKDTNCLEGCEYFNENIQKSRTKCKERNGKAMLCSENATTTKGDCVWKAPSELTAEAQKGSRGDVSDIKLYGGLFGTLLLMVVITTIVVVYISLKKKKTQATTSPIYETPRAMTNEIFARDFNRAEMTFTIDEFIRRRQSSADELGYDNEGMMVENPLYNSNMRAVAPFKPSTRLTASPDEVFAMSNTAV